MEGGGGGGEMVGGGEGKEVKVEVGGGERAPADAQTLWGNCPLPTKSHTAGNPTAKRCPILNVCHLVSH